MKSQFFLFSKPLIVLLLFSDQVSGQSWKQVEAIPSIWMTAIAATEDKLWVAGENKLYHLSGESGNWDSTAIIHPELQYISDILVHEDIIFVADEAKGIFISENRGQSWQDYNQGLHFTHVKAISIRGDSIFAGTIGAGIFVRNLLSVHGWQAYSSTIFWKNTESITNLKGTLVAGVGHNSTLYINRMNESTWTETVFADFNGEPSALLAITATENHWIAAGNNGLYSSSDEGLSWKQLNLHTGHIAQAALHYHNDRLYAHLAKSSGPSKFYYSDDQGKSWNIFEPSMQAGIDIIHWHDQLWYATQNGLWKLEKTTTIINDPITTPGISAYPNPFTDSLNLKLNIKKAGKHSIQLSSIDGKVYGYYEKSWLEEGVHPIHPHIHTSLNAGMYFITLISETGATTIKVFKSH